MMSERSAAERPEQPVRTAGQAEGGREGTTGATDQPERGRTPDQAEGDRETVEQSLREKEADSR